ncbi:MAG: cobalamin-binding protein [Candidatus Lokiarchaeota archaeon]|nr:cobalamin-binding protein [Candidatus Lokiarchaeota archaeon]
MSDNSVLSDLITAIREGNREIVPDLTKKAIDQGIEAFDIVTKGCSKAMREVGELYQKGEYFVPEILMSAKAFEAGMEVLEPHLTEIDTKASGTVVIGVCEGDIHSIGKNLVKTMLDATGFKVIDLGTDIPANEFIEAAKENEADIVAVSALMTTSMLKMEEISESLNANGVSAKLMVGGGPVSHDYAEKIGAHGYGKDAMEAVDVAVRLAEKE